MLPLRRNAIPPNICFSVSPARLPRRLRMRSARLASNAMPSPGRWSLLRRGECAELENGVPVPAGAASTERPFDERHGDARAPDPVRVRDIGLRPDGTYDLGPRDGGLQRLH